MSILLPEGNEQEQQSADQGEQINYKATERDERAFFLMYHMNFQPSEVEALNEEYMKWLIARFMAQKQMEQEMMERHRLMQSIGPNLKVSG